MKFWKRRRPVHIPAELHETRVPWPAPSEVVYEFLNVTPQESEGARALKDKITMTTLRG